MPRFFFHLQDGHARLEDREGVALPDSEAAWYQGIRSAREILMREKRELRSTCRIEIEDEAGRRVWAVPFDDLVRIGV